MTDPIARLNAALEGRYVIERELGEGGGHRFSGSGDGYFFALDDRTGEDLWHISVGGAVHAAPMTYGVGGRQYVTVSANHALFTFALPD